MCVYIVDIFIRMPEKEVLFKNFNNQGWSFAGIAE